MIISCRVKYCEIMPDSRPFVLFGLEALTVYSSTILPKRFEDFENFHTKLAFFWNSKYKSGKIIDLLPTLPGYTMKIPIIRDKIAYYLEKIVEILHNSHFHKYHPWIKIINEFFCIKDIAKKEEKTAEKIQTVFKKFVTLQKSSKQKKMLTFTSLPYPLIQHTLSFLSTQSLKPILFTCKVLTKSIFQLEALKTLKTPNQKSFRLIKIDLSDSDLANTQTIKLLKSSCSENYLSKLVLNRCKHINDLSIFALTSQKSESNEEFEHIGSLGIRNLSLQNCSIGNFAIECLSKLENIEELDVSGTKITDEGVRVMAESMKNLMVVRMVNTFVSNKGVMLLMESNVKVIDVSECRNVDMAMIKEVKGKKIIGPVDSFFVSLSASKDSEAMFQIKGHKDMLVRDICTYLTKKLNTQSEIQLYSNDKILKKHSSLRDLPQENFRISVNFDVVNPQWSDLPKWEKKSLVHNCYCCKKQFHWYNSKTNCRNCGKICCSDCAATKNFIRKFGYTIERVPICKICIKKAFI